MVSVDEFLDGLVRSRLLTAGEVHELQVSLPPTMEPTVKTLAAELVRRGRLTKYQAGRIAMGQPEGLMLGKYVIQSKIGQGGMGEVFLAEHLRMKRPVVVKILHAEAMKSEDSVRRFEREVEAAAQLSHPNIVTAFDADEAEGIFFLVMEYVDGEPLGRLVSQKGPLSIAQALSITLQAATGLEYAHSQGIIHRDIKPNNLLLDKSGVVKILDMGLARFDDGSENTPDYTITQQHQIVGTVEYMSPEQVDSSHVDRRSDIYSLGCTLFRLLTDHPPFHGETVVKTLLAHRADPIPSIVAERPQTPPSVDAVFQRMMAKSPEDRYQTMTEVMADLAACLRELGVDEEELGVLKPGGAAPGDPDTAAMTVAPTTTLNRSEPATTDDVTVRVDEPPKLKDLAVGIDLGTTFSAIAYIDDVGRPQVLSNAEGDKTTPSIVLVEGEDVIVGREASKAMATDMERVAECAKRDLGQHLFHQSVDGQQFPPEVLQAWILKKLRSDAEQQIGPFTRAVVTVPAYFDEVRRKATQDAGYIAGIDVLDIINEPTAAALAFGLQHDRLRPSDDVDAERVLVYDLGGGTFDVTIMEIAPGEFVTLATDGDVQLGGRDWDQRLVDYVAEHFIRTHGIDPREDPNTLGRMVRECEDAKRTLSARQRATIACDYQGRAERIEVTRELFEEITLDLLDRTVFTTRQTLQAAGLEWADIDHVLLVGGSTRMPAVREMLRDRSGRDPVEGVSPDEAVAYGAAIHAQLLLERESGHQSRVRVRNVNSHSLGIVGTHSKTGRRQSAPLIPRNTPLPAKAKRIFKTLRDGQTSVVAEIVEGETIDPDDCTQIGKCTVRDLPDDLPKGTPIEVRFQYEANGRLKVVVRVADAEGVATHDLSRSNNLDDSALNEWRQRLGVRAAEAR